MAVPGGLEPPTNGLGNRAPLIDASSRPRRIRWHAGETLRLTSRCVDEISGDIISKWADVNSSIEGPLETPIPPAFYLDARFAGRSLFYGASQRTTINALPALAREHCSGRSTVASRVSPELALLVAALATGALTLLAACGRTVTSIGS